MKKTLVLGIIGVGAMASTALGQGIVVGNYTGDSGFIGAPITYNGQTITGIGLTKAGMHISV